MIIAHSEAPYPVRNCHENTKQFLVADELRDTKVYMLL